MHITRRSGPIFRSTAIPLAILAALLLPLSRAQSTEWRVGPGRALTLPSQAAAQVRDGDTVSIDAAEYVDCATWTRHNLLLRGVGGFAHVRDKSCGGKAIWIVQGRNTVIENIEFSGATVVDKNGAGIRQEGTNLLVRRCFFHDNENGILSGADPASTIIVDSSEFADNGYGDGYSHNMYIGHVGAFFLRHSLTHRAKVGHNVKSRANETHILYNRISNEATGTASRDIDVPNGGILVVLGNVIQHGPQTQNSNLCGYGLEGLTNPLHRVIFASNTLVTQRTAGTFLILPSSGTDSLRLYNNVFVGAATILGGSSAFVDSGGNLLLKSIASAGFSDAAAYDYRLTAASPAVNYGVGPPTQMLTPSYEYRYPTGAVPRRSSGALDAGAFEYQPTTSATAVPAALPDDPRLDPIHPNPSAGSVTVGFTLSREARVSIAFLTVLGQEVLTVSDGVLAAGRHTLACSVAGLPKGPYWCSVTAGTVVRARLLVVE
ncbi:MAG: right-handed parallel beta-helix repeat-containing protein [Ignavibacteria bacterium]|nr:right-handed parallel beta-helix repeat-containing protein [Ignavibacteria bacterium]